MKSRLPVTLAGTLLAAAALPVLAMGTGFAAPPSTFTATLDGKSEIPDADPEGQGSFSAHIDGDQFCYGLTVSGIGTPTGAHVHAGNAAQNGGVVIPLTAPETGDPGTSSDCATVDPALLDAITKRPAQYYVNVHTAEFPGGAIRGQLHRAR